MPYGQQTGLKYTPSDRARRLAQQMTHQRFEPMTPVEDLYQRGKEHIQGSLNRFSMEDLRNIGQFPPIPEGTVSPVDYEAGGKELMATMFDTINPAAAIAKGVGAGLMTAYHGTPHKFLPTKNNPLGEFDLSKIGTGEGAQAYGHGIYLAENPGVAKQYRTMLSRKIDVDGVNIYDKNRLTGTSGNEDIDDYLIANMGDVDKSISDVKEALTFDFKGKPLQGVVKERMKKEYTPILNKLEDLKKRNAVKISGEGAFYDVDLPDEHIEKMLDWDAPLSEQPESVRKAIESIPDSRMSADYKKDNILGNVLYSHLSSRGKHGDGSDTSQYLKTLGIPGIKYFDAGSRSATDGTRNFVLFDPSIAKILSRE